MRGRVNLKYDSIKFGIFTTVNIIESSNRGWLLGETVPDYNFYFSTSLSYGGSLIGMGKVWTTTEKWVTVFFECKRIF